MATKSSTTAKKLLHKMQNQVTCGVCQGPYKQPKVLNCFYTNCEACLRSIVQHEELLCPSCCEVTHVPAEGVPALHNLFDVQEFLQKIDSSKQLMCSMCKKRETTGLCHICEFVCQHFTKTHLEWDFLKSHQLIDLNTFTADTNTRAPPLKKTIFCPKHTEKEADLFCESCDQLICRDYIVRTHRDHQYDLVSELFDRQDKVIMDSLEPVEKQIVALETAIQSVNSECGAVEDQKKTVVAEIHSAFVHIRQALEMKEAELVEQAEQMVQHKVKTLNTQCNRFKLQLNQLVSCKEYVNESRRNCSQTEVLKMKSQLLKQVNNFANSFQPDTLTLAEHANLRFAHNLSKLVKICKDFGRVYYHVEISQAPVKSIKPALRGHLVEALDSEGEAYVRPVDSMRCELVVSDGSNRVRAAVRRIDKNIYNISYTPEKAGEHQLDFLTEEKPILKNPFTVVVLPNFDAPVQIIEDLNNPCGIAILNKYNMVVSQDADCISIESSRTKMTFRSSMGPRSVAIDSGGNILVAHSFSNEIHQFSSSGKIITKIGCGGTKPLEFRCPRSIAVHPLTHKIYVADAYNHRIQVLNSDLTYSSSFGNKGSKNGELNNPYDIAIDAEGKVYVADCSNHRIQTFTTDGVFVREFGQNGGSEGKLNQPVSITTYNNVIFVGEEGNHQISIFSTSGEFVSSFGREGEKPGEFKVPYGLAVDMEGRLCVCDWGNNRIQIFN